MLTTLWIKVRSLKAIGILLATTRMPDSSTIPIIEIVPDGDMLLNVNSEARFKVSSAILCLASPVFRVILGPNSSFKEACTFRETRTKPYTLLLDDPDYKTFSILLYAIHLQSDKVTRPLDYKTMQKLATICDKYDCARAVESWVPLWKKLTVDSHVSRLFVAWVFRIDNVFTSLSKRIILEGYYEKLNGTFLIGDGYALNPLIPDAVVGEYFRITGSMTQLQLMVGLS